MFINYFKFMAISIIWILWFAVSVILCTFILAFVVLMESLYYVVNFFIKSTKKLLIKIITLTYGKTIFKKARMGDTSILLKPKYLLIIKGKLGNTPVHYLASRGVKGVLKLDKSLLMIKNNDGWTPIHLLAYNGVKEVLELDKSLLMIKSNYGNTPLHWLAINRVEILEELKQYI